MTDDTSSFSASEHTPDRPDQIPPLLPPHRMPPVHDDAALLRHWRALMGPLGFSKPALWLMFLGADGRLDGPVTQIDEIPDDPDDTALTMILRLCAQVIDDGIVPGTRVAFLRSRPGGATFTESDLSWADGLRRAARRVGVRCEPVHVASDERVRLVTYDDLGDRAAS